MLQWTEATKGDVEFHYGRFVGATGDIAVVQGPTKHNKKWRAAVHVRWKDMVHDAMSLDEAKRAAETMLQDFLAAHNLQVKVA